MTRISIAHEESDAAVARVETELEQARLRDPNWNGAKFVIERGAYTCVRGAGADDAYNSSALLHEVIYPALAGQEGETV